MHEQVEPFNKTLLNIFHNFILTKLSYEVIKILLRGMTISKIWSRGKTGYFNVKEC